MLPTSVRLQMLAQWNDAISHSNCTTTCKTYTVTQKRTHQLHNAPCNIATNICYFYCSQRPATFYSHHCNAFCDGPKMTPENVKLLRTRLDILYLAQYQDIYKSNSTSFYEISGTSFWEIPGDFRTEHSLSLQRMNICGVECKFKYGSSSNIIMILFTQISAT